MQFITTLILGTFPNTEYTKNINKINLPCSFLSRLSINLFIYGINKLNNKQDPVKSYDIGIEFTGNIVLKNDFISNGAIPIKTKSK